MNIYYITTQNRAKMSNQNGQTFIEFLLLLLMLIGLSYGLLAGVNGGVAKRWEALITVIAKPTVSPLTLR